MNKQTIITCLKGFTITVLALVAVTARAINEYQLHSGTAVLKGRILNKPADEWNIISVNAYDLFTGKEFVYAIPVAADGTFEGSIHLPHSQSVLAEDLSDVFLAVGDTVEVTKDAALSAYQGVTFGGHGTSADINRLWPEVKKHYFGNKGLFVKGLSREDMPAWKQQMVKLMDAVIADIEADCLPLPISTSAYVKEVMGASLLGELLKAFMNNYRYNITGNNYANINVSEYGEYYDFLAGRERWLLDNPAMLLVTESPDLLFNYAGVYLMIDIAFFPHEEGESTADHYRKASSAITSRYGLKSIGFMQQMVLCRHALEEDHLSPESDPDRTAEYVAGIIPLITNPIVASHVLDRYRQYVKQREANAAPPPSTFSLPTSTLNSSLFTLHSPSSIFQRIIAPYKGNTLFVDFWDMSCGPCRADMLQEREKVERLKDQPVRFLYICDEKTSPRQRTEKWLNDNGIRGEHIFVSHEEWQLLNAELQFNATPYNIGVDKHGNIVTYEAANKYVQEEFFRE